MGGSNVAYLRNSEKATVARPVREGKACPLAEGAIVRAWLFLRVRRKAIGAV